MGLPRSTYYHKPKNKTDDDRKLIERIEAIIEAFPGYGYRRVTRELHRRGLTVNHKKVLRIMRQQVELPLIDRTLFKLKLVSPELPWRLHL